MHACTIIARNYLPPARVLAKSFRRQHPDGTFSVLAIDDRFGELDIAAEDFEVLHLEDVGFSAEEILRFAAIYGVMEFATAVKPWLLASLVERFGESVVYLDPDIVVYSSLEEIEQLTSIHDVVLTPHATSPMPRDGLYVNESQILSSGIYNLGFVGVGTGSDEFLHFWMERLYRECKVDPGNMRFVDQRWVDFVPGMFDAYILREAKYNVAYWNLDHRAVEYDSTGYRVNGEPLAFFHFSGFNPKVPHLLSKHQGDRPRILLSEHPAVARLCAEYASSLFEAGYEESAPVEYAYTRLPSGLPFDDALRDLYRDALFQSEMHGGKGPPNPLKESEAAEFLSWAAAIVPGHRLSRYLLALIARRPDLRAAFPDPEGDDLEEVVGWSRHEVRIGRLPEELAPSETNASPLRPAGAVPVTARVPGIRVAGYLRAEMGVGELGRLAVRAIESTGIPFATYVDHGTVVRQFHRFDETRRDDLDVNLICVNADELPHFADRVGTEFFADRYSIGLWAWELEEFPARFDDSFALLDEVWALSDFARNAIKQRTNKPVLSFPPPIEQPQVSARDRASFGIPAQYCFLFCFDLMSEFERKNPLGLIDAFTRAFRVEEGPLLVIKAVNGGLKYAELEKLKLAASQRPDILLLDEQLDAKDNAALISVCDCYVSLHRSEGFGLTIAEAMALGKPVITTNYSGNLEFTTSSSAYLVRYSLSAVPEGCDPYPAGAHWADPDLDEAAELMRQVFENREEAAQFARNAQAYLRAHHTVAARAQFIKERFAHAESVLSQRRSGISGFNPRHSTDVEADAPELVAPIGPNQRLDAPSRHPRIARLFRRLVVRALRHHDESQSAFNVGVCKQLEYLVRVSQEVDQRSANVQASARASAARLSFVIDQLSQLNSVMERHAPVTRSIRNLTERVEMLTRSLEVQARACEFLGERADDFEREFKGVAQIAQELHSIPYMTSERSFIIQDASGKESLGFRSERKRDHGYVSFEDLFRGSEELVAERQLVYVDLLRGHSPVVDLGSGRGELLGLLKQHGITAIGVDSDDSMIARSRRQGRNVILGDALTYLKNQSDESVGAVFSAQFVEHVPFRNLLMIIEESHRILRDNGVLIMETINPHSVAAFRTFWTDLTHIAPIFPEVLLSMVQDAQFDEAEVLFPNGTGQLDSDRWQQGEYAVIARKRPAA